MFLKLAPLPHSRPVPNAVDFEAGMTGRLVRCSFLGQGVEGAGGPGYPFVVLAYSGGRAGRTEALQNFQRKLRRYDPERDGRFLSNTWGDRNRDLRINAGFMRKEIAAGAALGVDVVQIDDGWQKGFTMNSARGKGVWTGYWKQDPQFWDVDRTRFPEGLKPLVKEAAAQGMKFGLWFGPDSVDDFVNWQRDAARLLELHRNDGIDYFKIDSVKAVTKAGESNLRRMFDTVLRESQGKVVFDLDVTAEIRPGYFGLPDVGPIFVENRYTDFHRYWPHQTLRNLWKLAQYVDPLRLRMEVLNESRNEDKYAGDPLAPSRYSPDMLFATVMMSNPLGWFETSNLPESYGKIMAPLIAEWKRQRARMFSQTILPVGDAPDGTNWTGFVTFSPDRTSGYVLMFRGVNAPEEWSAAVNVFRTGATELQTLGGSGTVSWRNGRLGVKIPSSPGFVWARFQ